LYGLPVSQRLRHYRRESGYRIRLGAEDLEKRGDVLRQLIEMAYRGRKDKS
jgi:hypothetical protein